MGKHHKSKTHEKKSNHINSLWRKWFEWQSKKKKLQNKVKCCQFNSPVCSLFVCISKPRQKKRWFQERTFLQIDPRPPESLPCLSLRVSYVYLASRWYRRSWVLKIITMDIIRSWRKVSIRKNNSFLEIYSKDHLRHDQKKKNSKRYHQSLRTDCWYHRDRRGIKIICNSVQAQRWIISSKGLLLQI